jgi:hypothetical protein
MEDIMESLKDNRVPVEELLMKGRRTITSSDYYAAAMMTMLIFFAAGHGGRMIQEEKEAIHLSAHEHDGCGNLKAGNPGREIPGGFSDRAAFKIS